MRSLRCAIVAAVLLMAAGAQAQSPAPNAPFVQIVPHILSGGGCGLAGVVTKLTIVNPANSQNTVTINNIRQTGTLIDSTQSTIPANGTLRIDTGEQNRTASGCDIHWAMIGSQQPVNINLFFEIGSATQNITNTVGFNDVPPQTSFTLPLELQPTPAGLQIGRTLGLVVANVSNAPNTVTMRLINTAGQQVGTDKIFTLPAFQQTLCSLQDAACGFGAVLPNANFVGKVVLSSTGPMSAIGVGDAFGPFFSVPVITSTPVASGGVLTATYTMAAGSAVPSGTCTTAGVPLPGATTAMVVAISPQGDPSTNGLNNLIWNAYVDVADHVTVHFCAFSSAVTAAQNAQVFNIRVFSNTAGTFTLPAGTQLQTGTCLEQTTQVSGIAANKTVVASPAGGNILTIGTGWTEVFWSAVLDATGQVRVRLCKFARVNAFTATNAQAQVFNIGVLN